MKSKQNSKQFCISLCKVSNLEEGVWWSEDGWDIFNEWDIIEMRKGSSFQNLVGLDCTEDQGEDG